MLKIIKNGEVYAPEYLGKKDILIADRRIGFIHDEIPLPSGLGDIEVMDAGSKIVVPGFIDSHVHICGGGGEGSFSTRTPEIQLSDITTAGVTTVVGCLGTDGTTRCMAGLLAKARGLEEEGITTYIYTGSYQVPVVTITGSCRDDIVLIEKVIGVGEVAISDHRSSQPTVDEIARIASEARVGGMLAGKCGVVNLHLGDGCRRLEYLIKILDNTEIPATQFLPTHLNRDIGLLESSLEFALRGGYVDLTTSSDPDALEEREVSASCGFRKMLEWGFPPERITFSSDGQGSLPLFDREGKLIGLGIGSVKSLHRAFCASVFEEKIPIESALRVITSNVADVLKMREKGRINTGMDADIVILNKEDLSIDMVIGKGKILVENGKACVRGTFEKFDK
ncbi:MAG: beta-aspartyl-peptidase [Firmicutes bacterium]|nr:beta-aspartyl-peptidase [Bacillota bacterium]